MTRPVPTSSKKSDSTPRISKKARKSATFSGSRRIERRRARQAAAVEQRAAVATRAVGYARVSTEEQATHGHGLDAQERAVRAFAESQGYELVLLVSDPAISGATRPSERPGFGRILELAAEQAFTILLVHKFDRLAREIRYAVTTVSDLAEQHGVTIRSVTEPIDTSTPMGRTLFAILAGMAEHEREAITDRMHGGRKEKATRGGFAGGASPYGYARDREGGLSVVETEAEIVRRIFRERGEGRLLREIADGLNADGIRTRRGTIWRPGTVAYIADNPKYSGAVEYLFRRGTEAHVLREGAHEAIV